MIRILSVSEAFSEAVENGLDRQRIAACRSQEDAIRLYSSLPQDERSMEPGETGAFVCKISDTEYHVFRFVKGVFNGTPF